MQINNPTFLLDYYFYYVTLPPLSLNKRALKMQL